MFNIKESYGQLLKKLTPNFSRIYMNPETGEYVERILEDNTFLFTPYLENAMVFQNDQEDNIMTGFKMIFTNHYALLAYSKESNRLMYYNTNNEFVYVPLAEIKNICNKDDLYRTISKDRIKTIINKSNFSLIDDNDFFEDIILNIDNMSIEEPYIDLDDFEKQLKMTQSIRELNDVKNNCIKDDGIKEYIDTAKDKILQAKINNYMDNAKCIIKEIDKEIEENF